MPLGTAVLTVGAHERLVLVLFAGAVEDGGEEVVGLICVLEGR